VRGQQRVDAGEVLGRRLRSQRHFLSLAQHHVEILGAQRDAVQVFAVSETQPHRDHVDAQARDLVRRDVGARIDDDSHLAGMVQEAALALHVIGFLLLDRAERLAGQEDFRRVVHVDVNAHALLSAGDHQRTGVKLLQPGHDGFSIDALPLHHAFGAITVLADLESLHGPGQVRPEIGAHPRRDL
jgi:uncharacterized protein (DUF924 family)